MSRPAAVVHRVIKAYDVRGLVGEEIDESFVTLEVSERPRQIMLFRRERCLAVA